MTSGTHIYDEPYIEANSELKTSEREFYYLYLMSQLSEQEKFLIHYYQYHEYFNNYLHLSKIVVRDKSDYLKVVK